MSLNQPTPRFDAASDSRSDRSETTSQERQNSLWIVACLVCLFGWVFVILMLSGCVTTVRDGDGGDERMLATESEPPYVQLKPNMPCEAIEANVKSLAKGLGLEVSEAKKKNGQTRFLVSRRRYWAFTENLFYIIIKDFDEGANKSLAAEYAAGLTTCLAKDKNGTKKNHVLFADFN